MKKSLILGVLGLAASVAVSYGQGQINLDNYDSTAHPLVTYGPGSNGTLGAGVNNTYTIGLYWASGNIVGSVASDPTGTAVPTSLDSSLALGAGTGSSGVIASSDVFGQLGKYAPPNSFNPGVGQGATITVMLVAYNGSSYTSANSTYRGHSTAFTMTTSTGTAFPPYSGDSETDGGFQVLPVPEPSIFALSGLGAAALMLIRRKK